MRKGVLLFGLFLLTGCGLKTRPVNLDIPAEGAVTSETRMIVIDDIVDARDFNTLPESSGSRLETGVIRQLGESGRARAIAGQPVGPLVSVVANDRTVRDEVRALITAAMNDRGYSVVANTDAPPGAPRLRVTIREFWCYMPFNFGRALTWTQQLKAWITTDISITTESGTRSISVSGYGANIIQVNSERNVAETYGFAMADYRKSLGSRLFTSM
ncbi:hypothetical protein [Dyella sp. C9]|uniref:hypothetical protein n=1 Tax=Dyella sp. C9 TaxID=2202154 RepID=UPI001300B528|nr:hypothetical protein [Dyella sp. C9]